MLSKPLCSVYNNENKFKGTLELANVQDCSAVDEMCYNVIDKLVHKVWDDRHAYATVQSIFGWDALPNPKPFPPPLTDYPQVESLEHPMRPILDIDMDLIQGVVQSNSFGINPSKLLHSVKFERKRDHFEDSILGKVTYVWPSLINHSCAPSSHDLFIGDAIVVRASRDIPQGGEVTVSYVARGDPYEERMFNLVRSWRFECTCALCEVDLKDGEKARKERAGITAMVSKANGDAHGGGRYDAGSLNRLAVRTKKNYEDMKRTYKSERTGTAFGRKVELAAALRVYARVVGKQGLEAHGSSGNAYIQRAIQLDMDALALAGIKVTDLSVKGRTADNSLKSLPIEPSGLAADHEQCLSIVFHIVTMFRRLGDRDRARRWLLVQVWSTCCYGFIH